MQRKDKLGWLTIAIWGAVLVWFGAGLLPASGASVSIAWEYPYTNHTAVGFCWYYGNESRAYTTNVNVQGPDARNVTISDLDPGKTWYFAGTAYNSHNNESDYSVELVWDNTPPEITAPATVEIELEAGAPMVLADYLSLVSATDDFSEPEAIRITQEPQAGSPLTAGMALAFLAVDVAGNTGRVDRIVGVTIELTQPVRSVRATASNGRIMQVNEEAE